MGEGGITPTAGPVAAAHEEEKGEDWKDVDGGESCEVGISDQRTGLFKWCAWEVLKLVGQISVNNLRGGL